MNDYYQFESQEEFEEALNGEYGEGLQHEAQRVAEAFEAQSQEENEQDFEGWFIPECERLEDAIGRNLTQAEIRGLATNQPASGERADFVEKYGDAYGQRSHDKRGQDELAEEYAQETMDEAKAEEGEELPMLVPSDRGEAE